MAERPRVELRVGGGGDPSLTTSDNDIAFHAIFVSIARSMT